MAVMGLCICSDGRSSSLCVAWPPTGCPWYSVCKGSSLLMVYCQTFPVVAVGDCLAHNLVQPWPQAAIHLLYSVPAASSGDHAVSGCLQEGGRDTPLVPAKGVCNSQPGM